MCTFLATVRNLLIAIATSTTFPIYGQVVTRDTVFIQKDSLLGTKQSIFFDDNRNSRFYQKINYWKFDDFDKENYKYSTDYLKKHKLNLVKTKPVIPWTKWVILRQYKSKFYAYHPSDFYNHFKQSINDTTFIDWTGEGPVANKIVTQQKIDSKTYGFQLKGVNYQGRKLIIHIIDSQKGIAVFEQLNKGEKSNYYLMIAAAKLNTVPLIVNNSELEKQLELQFDVPDFVGLLETAH